MILTRLGGLKSIAISCNNSGLCDQKPSRPSVTAHAINSVSHCEAQGMRKYPDSVDHASTAFPGALGLRCLVVFTLALTAPLTRADVIYGETSDADLREDSTVLTSTAGTLLPGASGSSPVMDRSSVLVFKLPSLGAVTAPFTTAILRFNLASVTGTPPSVDLYGLGRRASATVLIDDYYGKTTTVDPTDATKLQDNILIPSSATGPISTNLSGGTALCDYLNTQYAGGAGADQYVFLRLSTDSETTSVARYTITAADSGSAGPPDTRPQIIYNEAPVLVPRPFIWVRDSEKAGILDKIANNSWATNVFNGMVSRVAADVASVEAAVAAENEQTPHRDAKEKKTGHLVLDVETCITLRFFQRLKSRWLPKEHPLLTNPESLAQKVDLPSKDKAPRVQNVLQA